MLTEPTFVPSLANQSMPDATVIPVLHYPDVPAAAEWLCRAFGFSERLRMGTHRVQLNVGQGAVVIAHADVAQSAPLWGGHSVMVRVRNVDNHFVVAKAAGAKIRAEPQSHPFGERQYSAADLAGHLWTFSQTEANVDPGSWGGKIVEAGKGAV